MFTSRLPFKISTLAIIFMLVFGGAQPAFASTNDDFSAATIIASLPYSTNADTTGATFQDGEPIRVAVMGTH